MFNIGLWPWFSSHATLYKRQKLLLVVVEISAMVVGMRDMLSQHRSSSTSMTLTDSYKNFLKDIYLLPIPSFREYRGCSLSNQIKMAELKHLYYMIFHP